MPSPQLLPVRNNTVCAGGGGMHGHREGMPICNGWEHRIPFKKEFIKKNYPVSVSMYRHHRGYGL